MRCNRNKIIQISRSNTHVSKGIIAASSWSLPRPSTTGHQSREERALTPLRLTDWATCRVVIGSVKGREKYQEKRGKGSHDQPNPIQSRLWPSPLPSRPPIAAATRLSSSAPVRSSSRPRCRASLLLHGMGGIGASPGGPARGRARADGRGGGR
jgi:hypothetical protein